jgi:hypothetical protein
MNTLGCGRRTGEVATGQGRASAPKTPAVRKFIGGAVAGVGLLQPA